MKKSFISLFLVISLLLTCFTPIKANATTIKMNNNEIITSNEIIKQNTNKINETIKKDTNETTVAIYNGLGEYIGEFDSIQTFEKEFLGINENQKGPVAAWILTAATVYGAISMINDFSYLLTGVDVKVWLRENVIVPFYEKTKTLRLYSASGGIYNPYPPNSYQYIQFKRTNFYWVET